MSSGIGNLRAWHWTCVKLSPEPIVMGKFTEIYCQISNIRHTSTPNMLNFLKVYKRCLHISYHSLDFVQQKETKFIMEQPYILPILYCQYYACWCPGDFRSQGISRYGIDQISRNLPSPAQEELISNKIVDHSDEVGASPVGAAPTTSSFPTQHLTSMDWAKTTAKRDEKHLSFGIWCALY